MTWFAKNIFKRAITKKDRAQFVRRKNFAVPILVSITETLVPLTTFAPASLFHKFVERLVLN